MTSKKTRKHTMTADALAALTAARAARDAYDLGYADARDALTAARDALTAARDALTAAYADARAARAAYAAAAYAAAHDATPTSDLIKASPSFEHHRVKSKGNTQ
jgi:hypothetical protein